MSGRVFFGGTDIIDFTRNHPSHQFLIQCQVECFFVAPISLILPEITQPPIPYPMSGRVFFGGTDIIDFTRNHPSHQFLIQCQVECFLVAPISLILPEITLATNSLSNVRSSVFWWHRYH